MVTKLGRVIKHHSVETKRYHVQEILKRGISVFSYAREVGISSTTIYRWMDRFSEDIQLSKQEKSKAALMSSEEIERLRQENAQLRVQLEDERLKRIAYEQMIRLAEETFNIPIEKKSGAKRSKR